MFDRIIVSADEENKFFEFFPIVVKAWAKFFPDVPVSLALVTERNSDDPLILALKKFGEVIVFPRIPEIPSGNQAKISRFVLASYFADEVIMIEDIDTIPLQSEFVKRVLSGRQKGELLSVGSEVYENTPHEGKFPISNITSEGYIFREIINPNNLPYEDLVKSFIGIKVFDEKEAIENEPSKFSDESLLRVLINNWGGPVRKARRDVDIHRDWIDRSWWEIDNKRLFEGDYVCCNFIRPFLDNLDKFSSIIEYITGSNKIDDLLIIPKLKILIIQENGRHPENREFRECFSLQRALLKLGHSAEVWGLNHDNFTSKPDFNSYDLIINLENYEVDNWLPDLAVVNYPVKMLWAIDAHTRGIEVYNKMFEEGKYDVILQSTLDFVDDKSVWFPNAYDADLIKPNNNIEKKYNIGFCGSLLNREEILNHFEKKYGLHKDINVLGRAMVDAVCSYKAHFNRNLANDINYRSFETIGCGTLLITNYNPQYEKLGFVDGENCFMYKNYGELDEKFNLVINSWETVKQIAENGKKLAQYHTYDVRAKMLLQIYAAKRSNKGYNPNEIEKSGSYSLSVNIPSNERVEELIEENKLDEAMYLVREILHEDPVNISALNNYGLLLYLNDNIEEAVKITNRVLEISPQNEIATQNLNVFQKGLGKVGHSIRQHSDSTVKVSAIVSIYNSEKFIRGCMEDLVNQTLYKKGELEIVLVNSGSEENEDEIIQEYLNKYSNIKYIKTEQREGIYTAWNRGIKAATGKYITNANTDDRHRQDGIEVLTRALEENSEMVLAYGNSLITNKPNETFENCTITGFLNWPDFNRDTLLKFCYIGPHPVWRKSLHDEFGFFDEDLISAGDYEFWLRVATKYEFLHVNEYIGLYWLNENTVSRKGQIPIIEAKKVQEHYKKIYLELLEKEKSTFKRKKILFVLHNFPPYWYGGVENYVNAFVESLSDEGKYEIAVLYPRVVAETENVPRIIKKSSHKFSKFEFIHNVGQPILTDLYEKRFSGLLTEFFEKNQFDIVHFHHIMNFPMNVIGIAKKYSQKVIFSFHDFWIFCPKMHLFNEFKNDLCSGPENFEKCSFCLLKRKDKDLIEILKNRNYLLHQNINQIDYFSAPSKFIINKLHRLGVNKEINKLPLGVKNNNPIIIEKGERNSLVFGYIGSIAPVKNIITITDWFSKIKTTAKLKIWGNGDVNLIREIQSLAESSNNIEYLGSYVPEAIPEIFEKIDILIIPSHQETFSIVLREAFSCMTPVLVSDIDVFHEVIEDGKNGIFFDRRDFNDFQKKIKYIVDNPKVISQLKRNITKPLSIKEDVKIWLKIYDKLIRDNSQAAKKVSIIIPLFNKLELTQNCIDALYANTEADLFELILVDNGSSDGTTEYIKRIAEEKSNIKIIVNKENSGFAKANNQGAEIAQGEYLVTLNNDTIVKKGWLGSLLNIAENDKSVAAVGAKLLFPDNTIQHAGVVIVKNLQRNEPLIATHIFYQQDKNLKEVNTLLQYQALTAGCLLIRKEAFFEVGGFDEIYWNGYEDVDLCFKLKQNNWQLVYQPKSEIIHFESQSGPERFSKNDENVEILVNRWLGKVYHDFVVESQDSVRETGAQITKYIPKPPRSVRASIIIVTYNSSGEILKNLSSVGNFMTREDEVIIVDNNSRDNTVEIIERFIEGRDNFRLLKNDKNLGFTVATNMGIKESGNNMIVLLNPDTVVTQNWLEKFEYHLRDENVMAVGPLSNYAAGLQNILAYLPEDEAAKLSASAINTILEENNRYKSADTNLLIGFCIAVKRSFFEEYGLLDEDLFLGNDDLELSWRIRENGGTLKVALDTFIYHEGQKSFATEKKEKTEKLVQESANKLYRKLEKYYGKGRVPSSMELWGMEWFNPTNVNPLLSVPVTASIIIPVFNQIEYTLETIESIYRETEENFELILIDNGSDEKTAVPLQKLSDEKENVKVIRNDENLGFPKAINQGLRAAHGKYVVIANNDIVVTKGWLRKMIVHAESRPNIGIVGTISNKVSGVQLVKNAEYKTIDEMQKFAGKVETEMRGKIYEFPRVAFLCTLIKWRVVEKIGGLDERFSPGNYEDDDYCLRAQLAGFKTVIALDVFIHHYGSKSFTAEGNEKYARLLEENKRKFINKWGGTPDDIWLKGKKPFEREIAIPLRKTFVDYVNSANTALNSRKYEESLHNLEKAIESFDESSGVKITDLLMLASKIAKLLNQSEKAEKYLLKFIQIDDKNAETYNLLGVIFEEKEEYEKALGFYEQSLKLRDDIEIKRKTDKLKNNLITKS